jgi:hypothetical protein
MKAIETHYVGPTNNRGSRIVASDMDVNRVTVEYRSELNSDQNHQAAALALLAKLRWAGTYYGGHTKKGMAWVMPEDKLSVNGPVPTR